MTVQDATITLGENMHDTGTLTVSLDHPHQHRRDPGAADLVPLRQRPEDRGLLRLRHRGGRGAERVGRADVDDGLHRADQADAERRAALLGQPHDPLGRRDAVVRLIPGLHRSRPHPHLAGTGADRRQRLADGREPGPSARLVGVQPLRRRDALRPAGALHQRGQRRPRSSPRRYTLAKDQLDEERSLLEFEPTEAAESSAEQRGLKVAYFNSDQMQVALQQGAHSNYRFLTDFVIRNAEEAGLYVNSDDSDCIELARRRRRPGSWATPRSSPACRWRS